MERKASPVLAQTTLSQWGLECLWVLMVNAVARSKKKGGPTQSHPLAKCPLGVDFIWKGKWVKSPQSLQTWFSFQSMMRLLSRKWSIGYDFLFHLLWCTIIVSLVTQGLSRLLGTLACPGELEATPSLVLLPSAMGQVAWDESDS